jgi:PAS domain S-box-containing protein
MSNARQARSSPDDFPQTRIGSDALWPALFTSWPHALLCFSREGRIILANPQAEELFGYERNELIGARVEALMPETQRGHLLHPTALSAWSEPGSLGAGLTVIGRRKDGSEFPAAINLSPQQSRGGTFVVAIVGDITALRTAELQLQQSEERHRRLIELSPVMYALLRDGAVQFINDAGLALLGASDSSQVLGRPFLDFITRDQRQAATAVFSSLPQGSAPTPFIEQKLLRLDGSVVEVEMAALGFGEGEDSAIQVVVRDVRERKRLAEMHMRALAAEESEIMMTRLLTTVSHELRTPLTAVRGYASTVLEYFDRLDAQEIRDYVQGIDAAAQHLSKIVADLLTLARIEGGRLQLELTAMGIGDFLKTALASHHILAPLNELRLSVPRKDPVVSMDSVRLLQVVNNLVENAVNYGGECSTIEVSASGSATHATVRVRDHGRGVPRDMLDAIFQPFVRGKSPETAAVSGTGLGLAVCRGIIEAHGGRIWASLPAGGGFEVAFRLPRVDCQD